MAETTIGINLKGNDQASQTIKKVAGELGQLGKISTKGGVMGGFSKLIDSGAKVATQSLGQLGGAISSLGPIGIAAGALLAGAIKRYNYEVEQNINAINDQKKALEAMADVARETNSHIEKRLKLEQQLRDIQDEIDGADAVKKAETKLTNTDAEIEAVRKQIEELDGVRRTAMRQAFDFSESVEDVRMGHAVWWETGTEKANKANLEAAEKARETAKKAAEEQLAAQQRLQVLLKQRELAEKNIGREKVKAEEEAQKVQEEAQRKAEQEQEKLAQQAEKEAAKQRKEQLDALQERKQSLLQELAAMQKMQGGSINAGMYEANSHQTALLLDRLSGAGRDSTSQEINGNVKRITDLLRDVDAKMKELKTA